mgnify:CR=1 FL=1
MEKSRIGNFFIQALFDRLKHAKVFRFQVSDEHMARSMGDHQGRLAFHRDGLWRDAACPEDRHFAFFNFNGIAEIWLVDVLDADRFGVADMDGSAVDVREAARHLHRADDVLFLDRAHANDSRALETAGRDSGN